MTTCLGLLAGAALSASAQLHEGDIIVRVDAWNRIAVGAADAQGNQFPTQRVFGAAFGESPNFTNDPGFDCEAGTFAAGTPIGFTIRAAVRRWDAGAFSVIPAERISVRLGPLGPTLSPTADQPVTGFSANAGSDGKWHRHLGYTLQAPAGAGVYVFELELWTGNGAHLTSRPLFYVFSQNASPTDHAAAIAWVNANWACPSDVNDDKAVDLGDFFDFLNAFDAGLGQADITGDNTVDLGDFFAFLNAFDAGC